MVIHTDPRYKDNAINAPASKFTVTVTVCCSGLWIFNQSMVQIRAAIKKCTNNFAQTEAGLVSGAGTSVTKEVLGGPGGLSLHQLGYATFLAATKFNF